jgi:hypothetical protein
VKQTLPERTELGQRGNRTRENDAIVDERRIGNGDPSRLEHCLDLFSHGMHGPRDEWWLDIVRLQ